MPRQPPPPHASSVPQMDLKQPLVDHREPQERHCPNEAALGEQVPSAGAQSPIPPLQSSCSAPGPSCAQGTARTLSGQRAVLAPEPGAEAWASEDEGRYVGHPLEPCQGENHTEQELSQGEINTILKLSQEDSSSDKTSLHENWRRVTIRTIWVNPKYPELLQDPLQEQAKAATPPASDEEVPEEGAESPVPSSSSCSSCSSRAQLAAQTLGAPQGVPRQPYSPRRALRALCTLLWCSCREVQLDD